MERVLLAVLGAALAASLADTSWAQAEPVLPPPSAPSAPSSGPASQPAVPMRSPAVRAAEKAKEPGQLVPEQRVIPQVSVPLRNRNVPPAAAPAASLPAGTVPGTVNDDAARCLAAATAKDKAACRRGS